MRAVASVLFGIVLGCAGFAGPGVAQTPETPGAAAPNHAALLAFLQSIYGKPYTGHPAPGIRIGGRAQLERWFVPSLAKAMADDAAAAAKQGDIGSLEGDAFIGAQDWDIAAFDIHVDREDADSARATVTFNNAGTPSHAIVTLRHLKAGWRIEDVDWGETYTLAGLFAPAAKKPAAK